MLRVHIKDADRAIYYIIIDHSEVQYFDIARPKLMEVYISNE